jgi:hypothetical protein
MEISVAIIRMSIARVVRKVASCQTSAMVVQARTRKIQSTMMMKQSTSKKTLGDTLMLVEKITLDIAVSIVPMKTWNQIGRRRN